ncbi:putative thioredoxin [uncultured virus]|jgi:thioredoxin 1|uniref:Putative thioredoxin n=1 Tax=uncultured virus TaxID=340016 RepID=A0A218MMB7_9VIRU|nr:putative thioredoxin [uncultured virus]
MKQLLYFFGDWCQPCKTLGPIMDQVSHQAKVKKINVDNSPEMASHYGVRSVPTVILVSEHGEEKSRLVGVQSGQAYLDMYNQN